MTKEMPPNNLHKSVAESTDFIMFTLNKMRRLFSGSSLVIKKRQFMGSQEFCVLPEWKGNISRLGGGNQEI